MPDPALTPKRPEYYVQTGSAFENPHGVPHDELVQYILENPAEVVAQVVFGKYVESSGLVFSGELIQNMIDRSLKRVTGDSWLDPEVRAKSVDIAAVYGRDPLKRMFATGVDFARQTDYTVLQTLDISSRPARLVYYRRLNRVPWETIYTEVGKVMDVYGPNILVDATGMGGDVIVESLESRNFCPVHQRTVSNGDRCRDRDGSALPCRTGDYFPLTVDAFHFSASTKKELIEHLRDSMSHGYRSGSDEPYGLIRVPPIVQLEEELAFYAWDDKRLTTDCLMSLALAAWAGLEDPVGDAAVGSPWGR